MRLDSEENCGNEVGNAGGILLFEYHLPVLVLFVVCHCCGSPFPDKLGCRTLVVRVCYLLSRLAISVRRLDIGP